jgi:cell division protein FtsB
VGARHVDTRGDGAYVTPLRLRVLRLVGRLTLVAVGFGVFAIVGVQFAGIAAKNLALSTELDASRAQIDSLKARETQQRRTIVRLSDPEGAIPAIHEELRLVGPREEIFDVRGLGQPTPAAHWDESQ